ncbi:hypothetical protein G7K_2064-t1 [Saitoella complicata NRRL Y-17804]|uniref:Uncharacterized protein n=1 Tax=Saitoella complicata (strain BCRC 22490 / CBS 7301 / JCM 7358 / NBRC 10748 / NRRL Y-17804) TaxID=698492 RepID=A0A0E9NDJ5_SAICN|nr:hypothetical protein G7K_2064-t1 [Saitoella complicata NRRL Y-17804]
MNFSTKHSLQQFPFSQSPESETLFRLSMASSKMAMIVSFCCLEADNDDLVDDHGDRVVAGHSGCIDKRKSTEWGG